MTRASLSLSVQFHSSRCFYEGRFHEAFFQVRRSHYGAGGVRVAGGVLAQQTESRITGRVLDDSKGGDAGRDRHGHLEEHRCGAHRRYRRRRDIHRHQPRPRHLYRRVRAVGIRESVARCRARRRAGRDRRCDDGASRRCRKRSRCRPSRTSSTSRRRASA